jgi:hypothetical protein
VGWVWKPSSSYSSSVPVLRGVVGVGGAWSGLLAWIIQYSINGGYYCNMKHFFFLVLRCAVFCVAVSRLNAGFALPSSPPGLLPAFLFFVFLFFVFSFFVLVWPFAKF